MGGGSYNTSIRTTRAFASGYYTKPSFQLFSNNMNKDMNPKDVKVRESCDSTEHPKSLAIILALDTTGSMGSIPKTLIRDGLPGIMDGIIKAGIPDPQVLFMGVGDHECDSAPLQVGQFESSDELLDKWLTSLYLEGGGGGNAGESYHLAWYFAAMHTKIDCFDKRGEKGFLFTIGDEPVLRDLPEANLKAIMGDGVYADYDSLDLADLARSNYNVFHIHVKEGSNGTYQGVMDGWKQLMGDNLLIVDDHTKIPQLIAETVAKFATASKLP